MSMSTDLDSMTHAEFVNAYGGPSSLEEFLEMKALNGVGGGGSGSTSLTNTYVGYGDGSNLVTGEAGFTYTAVSALLSVPNITVRDTSTMGALQGTEGDHLHKIISAVGLGTAYTLTASYAAVDLGTTDPSIVLSVVGTYRIFANLQVSYVGTTYANADDVSFKIRRTNNTATDLTDGERGAGIPVLASATTKLGPFVTIGPIEYATTVTDDAITIFGKVSNLPGAGTVTVTKATIFAERIR